MNDCVELYPYEKDIFMFFANNSFSDIMKHLDISDFCNEKHVNQKIDALIEGKKREIELKYKEIEQLKSDLDTLIKEKSVMSHDNKGFIRIKYEKFSIKCDQSMLNKEQTQDDIC